MGPLRAGLTSVHAQLQTPVLIFHNRTRSHAHNKYIHLFLSPCSRLRLTDQGEKEDLGMEKKKKSPGSIFRRGLIQGSRSRKLDTAHGWPSQGLSTLVHQRPWDNKSLNLDDSKLSFRTQSGLRFRGCIHLAIDSPGFDGLLKMSLNHSLDLEASLRSLETWEDSGP